MLNLCIGDLKRIVGGELHLGVMPPLAGELEPVRRVVVETSEAQPGDVYWAVTGAGYDGSQMAEQAFLRGALGVVIAGRHVEPWAGRFSLRVTDTNETLQRLARYEQEKHVHRKRRPFATRGNGSTRMIAAWFRGAAFTLEDIVEEVSRGRIVVS